MQRVSVVSGRNQHLFFLLLYNSGSEGVFCLPCDFWLYILMLSDSWCTVSSISSVRITLKACHTSLALSRGWCSACTAGQPLLEALWGSSCVQDG